LQNLKYKAVISNLVKCNVRKGIVTLTGETCQQNGDLVLTNTTEAVVKCKHI